MIKSRYTANITDALNRWWELAPNCIAAYQPKDADDYQASKVNLANPGVYDAVEGTAPTWDKYYGWQFLGTSSQYLSTNIVPANGYSLIVKYSNANIAALTSQSLAGYHKTGARFRVDWKDVSFRTWASGGYKSQQGVFETSGVMCVAGQTGYFNGIAKVTAIDAWTATADGDIWIGNANGLTRWTTCYIEAVAVYSGTLTSDNVLDITNAMNAL